MITFLLLVLVVDSMQRCSHPQAEDGHQITEGCLQRRCKLNIWRSSLVSNKCCYEREAYFINTTIYSSMSEDGCAEASIDCVEETPGNAKTVLSVKNYCEDYATKEQLEEIKELLAEQMELGPGCHQGENMEERDIKRDPPKWLDDQAGGQFYGYVTGTANLTCQAKAEPPPTFQWLDAENVPVSSGKIVNEDYKSVLILPVVDNVVFGAYTCIAENIHGKLEKVVMLTEGNKPGPPHINPLKIYPDGLDIYIEEPHEEMFLRLEGFQVEVKEINKSWDQAFLLKNFELDKANVYHLDGLQQQHNTYYHVRAKSRNKAGLSDASNIIYHHTTGLD